MSERIEVGDLVVIVRWPCCGAGIGRIHTVSGFTTAKNEGYPSGGCCGKCGKRDMALGTDPLALLDGKSAFIPLAWLRKIPPLSELESTERKEKITA